MKHSMFILGLVVVCVMGGCRKESVQPESAALALYERYAENDHGLTVAYLGDFRVKNQLIDAVMLTAPDEQEWQWLCEEFGVHDRKGFPTKALAHYFDSIRNLYGVPDTAKQVTHVVHVQGGESMLGDSAEAAVMLKQLSSEDSNVQKEAADRLLDRVMQKMFAGCTDMPFPTDDTVASKHANIKVLTDTNMQKYDSILSSLKSAPVARRHGRVIVKSDTSRQLLDSLVNPQRSQLLSYAKQHGYQGSVVSANFEKKTLWLFFFRNSAEFDAIIKHINQEIFPFD